MEGYQICRANQHQLFQVTSLLLKCLEKAVRNILIYIPRYQRRLISLQLPQSSCLSCVKVGAIFVFSEPQETSQVLVYSHPFYHQAQEIRWQTLSPKILYKTGIK